MGISIPTLQNYKLLADMIPELDDFAFLRIRSDTKMKEFDFTGIFILNLFFYFIY